MKILFAIVLMVSVISSEFAHVLEYCNVDVAHLDISFEGEGEKESKENVEDMSKLKIRQGVRFVFSQSISGIEGDLSKLTLSTPYLEVYSPPPELV